MTANAAVVGFGTLVKIQGGVGGGAHATITDLLSVTGPGAERGTIDVTHMTSPGGWREFKGGLRDGGEVTFQINYLTSSATHAEILSELAADTGSTWEIYWSNITTTPVTFTAFVTGFEPGAEIDGALTASITLKVTGAVTWVGTQGS